MLCLCLRCCRVPKVYLPPSYQHMSTKSTGVAEPLLFQIPLIKQFVEFFGCVEPASKEGMKAILARKVPFGILPGKHTTRNRASCRPSICGRITT